MHLFTLTEPSVHVAQSPHPQEDFSAYSPLGDIIAVADGVTLEKNADGSYPQDSGAAHAARLFCTAAVRATEAAYASFGEEDLLGVFRMGNAAVGEYNRTQGRTQDTLDYLGRDFFSATAAFTLCKDHRLYWFSLCDSYVAVFSARGCLKFLSPEPWDAMKPVWKALSTMDGTERKALIHKKYRNGRRPEGGYGVATGEAGAEQYLNCGSRALEAGDIVVACTDGFEPYLHLPDFSRLLADPGAQALVRAYAAARSAEDAERFGAERTLAAIVVA